MDRNEEWDDFVDEWDQRRRLAAYLVCYYCICKGRNKVEGLDENGEKVRREVMAKRFGEDRATGLGAETQDAKEKARPWETEREHFEDGSESSVSGGKNIVEVLDADEHDLLESFYGMKNDQICARTRREITPEAHNKYAIPSASKKRKATSTLDGAKLNEAISNMVVAIHDMNQILKESNDILRMSIERSQPRMYTEEEVYAELMRLGVDVETRMEGYSFLTEDPARVRAFFGCPVEDRMKFLSSQMQKAIAL